MNNAALATGMVVSFGRSRGEHTLGEVVRITRKNVKVKQLEPRGSHKSYEVGSLWLVPKNMISPAKVPQERIEAGKKLVAEHGTVTHATVKLKPNSGIIPVKDARNSLRDLALRSAGIKPSIPAPANWMAPKVPDVRGCPVLTDPVTGYQFVGNRGEDLGPFIERIKDVVAVHR